MSVPGFSNMFKNDDFQHFEIPQNSDFPIVISWIIWSVLVSLALVLGLRDTSQNPEIMNMMGFRSFP